MIKIKWLLNFTFVTIITVIVCSEILFEHWTFREILFKRKAPTNKKVLDLAIKLGYILNARIVKNEKKIDVLYKKFHKVAHENPFRKVKKINDTTPKISHGKWSRYLKSKSRSEGQPPREV